MRFPFAIALALPLTLCAQEWEGYRLELDTTVLRIGEQATLTIIVDQRAGTPSAQWPVFADTLSRHIEVVHDSGVDTLPHDPEATTLQLVRKLKLTSFDTGRWPIPPFRFVLNGGVLETPALSLQVNTVALDSTSVANDIRDIYEPPFSWMHWARERWIWFAAGGGALLLTALVLLLVRRRPKKAAPVPTGPVIPLHERILAAMHGLEKERLWQQGAHKEYQSRLTDLVRAYIEERYNVPALERTTDELLAELKVSALSGDHRNRLANMLRSADLVKFAKFQPAPAENEQLMVEAVRFVQGTMAPAEEAQPTSAPHAR